MTRDKCYRFIQEYKVLLIILILGTITRLFLLGVTPGNSNLNQDEAFAAYEAYSLANYGMDSHGYHNPVYLVAWGSGMNALETYCMIPFVKLLGLNSVALRLPQAILGCITLVFVFLLIREISNEKTALWATFVLAICPWHVMLCRWGLESNFIVGMLTIALYLLIFAHKSRWKLILAGVFMGLVLYCYAAAWMVLPLIVIGMLIYLYFDKSIDLLGIFWLFN